MSCLRAGKDTCWTTCPEVFKVLGVSKVMIEVERENQAAIGKTEFSSDGLAQIA